MWRLLTHVLIKIILYKIYHFLCLLWINSLPWKAWVMLCGDGCWLYLSLCWLKMRNKGGRDYIKSQERKWTHAVCCNSGLSDFLMCSCMNDLGWKNACCGKKDHRQIYFFWSVFGWVGGGMEKKNKWYQENYLCSNDWYSDGEMNGSVPNLPPKLYIFLEGRIYFQFQF